MKLEQFVAEFVSAHERIPQSYEPREDSFLMLEVLGELNLRGVRVLDMGTGSGILATYCAKRGAEVTASDIDADAIEAVRLIAQRLGTDVRVVISDLFSEIEENFDIIVFNPPYLPSDRIEDRAVDGGAGGTTIIRSFLEQLSLHLNKSGFAIFVASSLNNPQDLTRDCLSMSFETVREWRFFFETLYVIKAKLRDLTP